VIRTNSMRTGRLRDGMKQRLPPAWWFPGALVIMGLQTLGGIAIAFGAITVSRVSYGAEASSPPTAPAAPVPVGPPPTPTSVPAGGASGATDLPPAASTARQQAFAAVIAAKIAELGVTPKTIEVPSDRAFETTVAIKQGDYSKATQIAREINDQSKSRGWGYYPFNKYIATLARSDDPALLAHLDEWLRREPKSVFGHLFRGIYYHRVAWAVRGNQSVEKVPPESLAVFKEDIARSINDLQTAINLNPKIPWIYYELQRAATSQDNASLAAKTFESGIAAFPEYYPLYQFRLGILRPSSVGSIDPLYTFVAQSAGRAEPDSPLKLLYVDLYTHLMNLSSIGCNVIHASDQKKCIETFMSRFTRPELTEGVLSALKLYKSSDPIEYSTAIWPLLDDMACNRCFGSMDAVGVILQTLADIMGTDIKLMDEREHNNYVLEDVTAWVWAQMGNNSNSDQKFREALEDVEHTNFPLQIAKAEAKARILGDMAQVAENNRQYEDSIAYAQAANLVGGINHAENPIRQCHLFWKSNHPAEAVKECTRLIEADGNNLDVIYYRGMSYLDLHQWDASINDLKRVMAHPDNGMRVAAAINMSLDYAKKGDYAGELQELNTYLFIFDEKAQDAEDLAIVYNNRCFSYMKLGEFEKALSDCTTSLKYGHLPDALSKEQELMKLLSVHNE
jgi:tetratricopeptide (TPR) repeat protein